MICKTGDRSIIETECFIRAGVSNNSIKDNFLDLLVYYNKKSGGSNYKTVDSIKHHILTTLDEEKFNKLNNGNLAIQFKNKGITEPFQNYLEYVISSQHKYLEYFYDFLTSPSGIFGEEGFKLLIVEYSEHRGGETEKLKCFDFLKADKIKEGDKIGICMYHKQPQQDYGIYEIIGLYKKDVRDPTLRYDVSGEEGHEKVQLHGPSKSDTNIYINQLIKVYNEQCTKEEPSNLIAQAGDGMNIINTKIDIADIDTAIELAEYSIKHYIKDTYNKITAIAVHRAAKKPARGEEEAEGESKLFMIPVYPQNQHLPHLPRLPANVFYKSLSPENIPTQAAWDEVMKEVNDKLNGILVDKLNQNVFNTYIKPIHTVKKGDENIGIIIASGHYIKLIEIEHAPESNTSIEPYKIDTRIWERDKEIDKKSYKTALTIEQITGIIGEEADAIKDKRSGQTVALKYEGIYIPVHTEQTKEDNTLPDEEVEDYNKYIADAIRVNQQHKYKLHCLPVRGYMDGDVHGANPKYTHIILETGLKVKLKHAFSISEKDEGEEDKYKIERIIEEPIIEQIFGNIIPDYDSICTSRSINNDKINYKGDINKMLKLELYLLMQKPEFSTIKQILLDILDCRYYSKFTKKIFIWPAMNYILDLIIQPVDKKAGDKYPKLDIENSCNNTVIENDYCTEKTTPSEMGAVIGELEYIEEAFSLCHKVKDVEGEEDVKEMADAKRKNILEIKQQSEAFEKIRGEYNTFRSRAVGLKLKKLKILQPPGNNFIDQLKSDIINNIIYNKYRREQIFTQYTNTDISNKYKVHEPYEHLISHYDYNISVLEALYKFKRQQYYNENIPFDLVEYNQELNYNISKTKQTGTRIHFKEATYQPLPKTIKYTIKGEIENYGDNIKKLDEGSVSKLYNLLYSEQFHPGLLEKCERQNSTPERYDIQSMDHYIILKLK